MRILSSTVATRFKNIATSSWKPMSSLQPAKPLFRPFSCHRTPVCQKLLSACPPAPAAQPLGCCLGKTHCRFLRLSCRRLKLKHKPTRHRPKPSAKNDLKEIRFLTTFSGEDPGKEAIKVVGVNRFVTRFLAQSELTNASRP